MLGAGYIKRAWTILWEEAGPFILGGLILIVINSISSSILTGPVIAGFMYMTLRKLRGERVTLGDAFKGFENFVNTFVAGLVYLLMVAVGMLFLIIPGIVVGAMFIYMFPFIVDKNMDFSQAFKASLDLTSRRLLDHCLFFIVLILIQVVGVLAFGIGIFVTIPLMYIAFGVAYYNLVYPSVVKEKQSKGEVD